MALCRIPLVQMCLLCAFVLCIGVGAQAQSGPVFVQHPTVTVNCGEPVPDLPACEATSPDCPGPVSITSFESETGALENHCTVSPSKLGNSVAWAFWLSLENMPVERWKFDGPAYFEKYADGTAHLWGTIVNYQNSSYKFEVSLWFHNRRNWEEWSALGRGYRNDSGLAGDNYVDWDYYELMSEFSTFIGIDGLAGDHLDITPFPTSMFYGFQSGIGANNKNDKDGFGGAFGYTGMVKGEHCGAGVGHLSVDTNCDDGNAGCAATTYTRICRAEDTCGNVAFHTYSVNVVDNEAPTLLPYETVIEVECGQHYNNFISATDNCSEVVITYTDQYLTPGCNGEILRTYTVADACGNTITATQTIHLFGDAEPIFTIFPEDTQMSCSNLAEMNAADIQWEGPCMIYNLTYTDVQIEGNCPGNYTIVRTYTLTDDCGNQITRDWTVVVYDNEAPVLQGVPASVTINCGEYIEEVNVTAQDNCDTAFLTVHMSATTEYLDCGYNFIRTWTALDGCGNVAEASQVITLIDQQPPVFTYVPADVNLACANGMEYDENEMAIAEDDCVGVTVVFEDFPLEGNCGTGFTRVFTAIDLCGNTATATQTVSFIDTTAPVFAEYPSLIELSCNEQANLPEPVVTDECSTVSLSYTDEPMLDCTGGFVRTYTATDGCGNSSNLQVEVRYIDNTPPVVTSFPEDITLQCNEALPTDAPGLNYFDACSDVTVTFDDVVSPTDNCINTYNITRTYTLTDACGNSTEVIWNIHVTDTIAPQLHGVPADITLNCGEELPAYNITATDNCSGDVLIYQYDQQIATDCGYQLHRMWVATDACNNSSSAVQIITFIDNQAPQFSFIPQDTTIVCDGTFDLSSILAPEVFDDCGEAVLNIIYSVNTGTCNDPITITYLATDNCGNINDRRIFVTIEDNEAPVFTFVPGNTTINCGEDFELPLAQATDNCSDVTIVYEDAMLSGCGGGYIRTYTATDACGNEATASVTVTIIDNEAPVVVSAPIDVTVDCNNIPTPEESGLEYYDLCGSVSVGYNENIILSDVCPNNYTVIREYTLTDDCGNSTVVTWTINVQDNLAPLLSGVPADITLNCGDEVAEVNVTAQDNCDGPVLVNLSATTEFNECGYDFIRTWTAEDACGNVASASQTVTLIDLVPPVFTFVPEDVEISCSEGSSLDDLELATATDDCMGVIVTYEDTPNSSNCGSGITRTFTAIDACGNTVTATQQITFVDNEAPVFTFVPADITVNCGEEYELPNPVATDNCGAVTITSTDIFGGSCAGGFQRVYTATDACGNSTTATVNVNIIDNTPPVVPILPVDVTVSCDNIPSGNDYYPEYEGECSSVMFATSEQYIPGDCPNNFIIQRKWILTDVCGNSTTVVWNINVVDDVAPVLHGVPADVTLTCGDTVEEANVTATDNCGGNVEITYTEQTEQNACGYNIIRIWTATDVCGNTSEATQTITFIDQVPPVFTYIPADITISCGSGISIDDLELAEATDDCMDVVVTYQDEFLGSSCEAGILRTFTAMDACGNTATATQMITYGDNEAPVFGNYLSNLFVDCSQPVPAFDVMATDNCTEEIIYTDAESMIVQECGYQLLRTRTATDACGNSTTITQTVTVEDFAPPVFSSLPADITISCDAVAPAPENITAYDQCSGETQVFITETTLNGSCPNNYTIYRVYRSSDACGNEAVHIQTITVEDNQGPTFINFEYEIEVACEFSSQSFAIVVDNCSNPTFTYTDEVFGSPCNGGIVRTYVATDACGNQTTRQQFITIIDENAPVFTNFPENITVSCDQIPSISSALVTYTDNCSAVDVQFTETVVPGSCPNNYTLNRTWTLYDDCFNSTSRTWSIQVTDNEAPTILGVPMDSFIDCTESTPPANVIAIDNCGEEVPVSLFATTVEVGCDQVFTRRWVAIDGCGNMSQALSNVIITDMYAPELSEYPEDITLPCGSSIPAAPIITAIDNCADEIEVTFNEVITPTSNCQIITREWCASDCVGNEVCHTQVITMEAVAGMIPNTLHGWTVNPQLAMVEVTSEYDNNWELVLFDINGRIVEPLYKGFIRGGEKRTFTFNPRMYEDGIYILRYSNGKDVLTQKILIAE